MDPLELLTRGVTALLAMIVLVAAARFRFRQKEHRGAPTDIGLD